MTIGRPRGTNDFLPEQTEKWQAVEALLHEMGREYGYGEIRTPIFEETELFARGVGGSTDIVQKEMYTFADLSDRSLTLRPENTAAVCRAYLENKLYGLGQPVKLYYLGPMFRYERPQAGRFRQFHQFGLEFFGNADPMADVEVISFAWDFYHRLGLKNLRLLLNSVGCPKCRPVYRQALQDYFRPQLEQLCNLCRDRFERNPLRILDCKNEQCIKIGDDAPVIEQYLCADCAEHYTKVKRLLDLTGIAYTEDVRLVRGLDYYTRTAFEIVVTDIGAKSAVCGGGRYDGLVEQIGGAACPAVGFAMGMERIFTALAAQNEEIELAHGMDVWVIGTGSEQAREAAFAMAAE
ncbi:MAG: histidine--tRNA ligase, partial [Clostridiales bacterium]